MEQGGTKAALLNFSESRAPPPLNLKSRSVFDEQLCMDDIPPCGELAEPACGEPCRTSLR